MNQTWNIFRKDFRHHWPEILVSFFILAAFCWIEVHDWHHETTYFDRGIFTWRFLYGLSFALLLLSWVFLIVRAIQSESAVGDRQFWITRPYDWKKLLLAKMLFILVFINLPLLLADIILLSRAGFNPLSHISGLLWMQMMWFLMLFLSAGALATVTATLAQILLALLFVILYVIGMVALSQVVPNADVPVSGDWQGLLLVCTSVAVIFLQYCTRKTALSRWLIVALCTLLTLSLVLTPYRSLVARDYPASTDTLPIQLSLLPQAPLSGDASFDDDTMPVSVPLNLSGLPPGSFLKLNGMIVTITNDAGLHWDSGWKTQSDSLYPESNNLTLRIELKSGIYRQLKAAPFRAHLFLAFSQYHDKNQRQFVVPSGEFHLPGLGICSTQGRYLRELHCRVPLRRPNYLLVTSDASASTCPLERDELKPSSGDLVHASVENGDSEPAEMGISPIHESEIYLSGGSYASTRVVSPGICPGTPLTLSSPEFVGHKRIELQFDDLSLVDYRPNQSGGKTILNP